MALQMNRRTMIGLGIAGVVLVGAGIGIGVWASGDSDQADPSAGRMLDRNDPESVVSEFITRYATGDGAMCELVDLDMRSDLERDGRCGSHPKGTAPRIEFVSRGFCDPAKSPSGSRYGVKVEPAGDIGEPYATVGARLLDGEGWAVTSLLPISEAEKEVAMNQSAGNCAPRATEYGG